MTTEFKILLDCTDYSQRDITDVLDVRLDSVRSWYTGRRNCPDGVLLELLPHAKKALRGKVSNLTVIEKRLKNTD